MEVLYDDFISCFFKGVWFIFSFISLVKRIYIVKFNIKEGKEI